MRIDNCINYKTPVHFVFMLLFLVACQHHDDIEPQKRLNVLFAISDDQSHVHTSFAGCQFINTLAFDRVAKEGVYFTNCYAGSPGCAPSRSSIVTGRYHWQNEQSGQHASSWMKKYVPFVDVLDSSGYVTGRTGKGVGPFTYARSDQDSLWRKTNAGGITHSNIRYGVKGSADTRPATGINPINYFANFKHFMEEVRDDEPFFFWYGASEPHRVFEQDSWKRTDKKLVDAEVPGFLPDVDIVRGDLLDYAVEIEWFDKHLGLMLDYLEENGELDNTVVIVTSDNGMAFPRAKANCYEYGAHVPLAIRYPNMKQNQTVDDLVSFIDFAPTILEIAHADETAMLPISGKSISSIIQNNRPADRLERNFVMSGRERHSSSRYENWGYPQRAIRSNNHLLIWNQKSDRWPAGAPQKFNPQDTTQLLPLYGLNESREYLHQGAFTDIDDCPTKELIIENYDDINFSSYFDLSHNKRPEYELFDVVEDPYCLDNLVEEESSGAVFNRLKKLMEKELVRTGDPRMVGPDKEVFDSYIRYSKMRKFPRPS